MNIRKLEVFLDLSETLSYSETAYRLFTTQGNISKIIKSLEEELGTQLFERSHRNIVMTESAKAILIYARDIVSQNNQLIETINGMNNKNGSQIQLDTIPTMSSYKSFSILSKFMAKNHQINFKLTETEGSLKFINSKMKKHKSFLQEYLKKSPSLIQS
ncbi:LysR family transcriptional regulator [Companilactobacillus metriopterae]|uniref:LysR family transcriptional regulator n=1 Tax=Companilactobacillus metriopterae TaxID=1909267 RepID=UPI0013E989A3|nr:LysR family transcriptional regulator [Companilactobacillus metriopterae]